MAIAIPIVSIALSATALVISLVALWRTHLAPFKLKAAVGVLRLRIYPIANEGASWFIASFDLPVTVANEGARPGKVGAMRMKLSYPGLDVSPAFETWPAKFVIDRDEARTISSERFSWLERTRDWMPFLVLPKEPITEHTIFETRWDAPVVQAQIDVSLEIAHDASKGWNRVAEWRASLDAASFGELANVGTSLAYPPKQALSDRPQVEPDDLHELTKPREPIPAKGFDAAPSYLDRDEAG